MSKKPAQHYDNFVGVGLVYFCEVGFWGVKNSVLETWKNQEALGEKMGCMMWMHW